MTISNNLGTTIFKNFKDFSSSILILYSLYIFNDWEYKSSSIKKSSNNQDKICLFVGYLFDPFNFILEHWTSQFCISEAQCKFVSLFLSYKYAIFKICSNIGFDSPITFSFDLKVGEEK